MDYTYHGDRIAKAMNSQYVKQPCRAVRRKSDNKCIRGKNANMLVEFEDGKKVVVTAYVLRKIKRDE